MRRALLLLALLVALPAAGQTAGVGAEAGPGGTIVGRVCVDLDRDDACQEEEPGISGARVRFEDGRTAIADEGGEFHAVEVPARTVLPDRSAYGAHAVSVEGLGVTRSFELAPRGAARVELPVRVEPDEGGEGSVSSRGRGSPRVDGVRILWPIAGTAPPGARVRSGAVETRAAPDGSWGLSIPLDDGLNRVGVAIETVEGGLSLWGFDLLLARPSSGPLRAYPARPTLLATLVARPAGDGAVLVGRVARGVALAIGGRVLRSAEEGRFGAWVSAEGGGMTVRASSGSAAAEGTLRPAILEAGLEWLLLGEGELQMGGEAGLLATGRLAGTALARFRGFRAEGGIDLDDRDRGWLDLSSPRDGLASQLVLDPQRTFVSAGDRAELRDSNAGRGRLWARVDGHGLSLRVGSARTGLDAGELGRHDRVFFGGRMEGETELGPARLSGRLVGGRVGADSNGVAPGVPAQDVLAATGGSLYYLSQGQLVTGSEIVRIEWRDPLSRLVVASRELERGRDYELDPLGGRLLLARPLAGSLPFAALAGGDPMAAAETWLVVDYVRLQGGAAGERGVAGGELRAAAGPLALSLGGASESRPGSDWSLLRGGAALDLGKLLGARVEFARSEGRLFGGAGRRTSLDGGFAFAAPSLAAAGDEALAFHAAVHGEAGTARWRGWWRERPAGFSDGEYDEPLGARERGALAEGSAGPVALELAWVERRGVDSADPAGVALRDAGRAFASAAIDAGPVTLTVEGLHEWLSLPRSGEQSAGGLRAGWRVARGLSLEASHLQAFGATGEVVESTFTAAGAALRTPEGTVALRAGWGPALGPRLLLAGERGDTREGLYGTLAVSPAPAGWMEGAGSAVGGRQRIGGGSLFTEERVSRDPLGVVAGRAVGGSLTPAPGLTLAISGERGERRRLDGSTVARGAGGLSAAWERGALRLDARAELRTEGSGEQWLAGGGAEWSASRRLTLAARALLADGELSGRRARATDGWLSVAWRSDALSVLGRAGRVIDDRTAGNERDASIVAVAAAGKVLRRATLGLGIDAARQRVGGTSDDRIAGSVRGTVAVIGPLDVALEYARRGSLEGREIGDLDALRAEAGVTSGGVRLAMGYALAGFQGSGIDPEETDGRFYLRAVVAR